MQILKSQQTCPNSLSDVKKKKRRRSQSTKIRDIKKLKSKGQVSLARSRSKRTPSRSSKLPLLNSSSAPPLSRDYFKDKKKKLRSKSTRAYHLLLETRQRQRKVLKKKIESEQYLKRHRKLPHQRRFAGKLYGKVRAKVNSNIKSEGSKEKILVEGFDGFGKGQGEAKLENFAQR